jgi:plastocyanin
MLAGGMLVAGIGTANAASVTVAAVNFEFRPETRSVGVGDTVRWTFAGDPHTVTSGSPGSPDGRFDSGIKDPGATYQVTFDTAGTFRYFCQIHPEQMTGTIVVSAGPAPTPKPTPKPTAKPTARPTASPTARPTATATARPSPTNVPTASPTAAPTASASPSVTASVAPSVEPSRAPAPSASSGQTPSPTAGPGTGQSAAGTDPLPIVLGIAVLAVLVAGGLALARRRGAA